MNFHIIILNIVEIVILLFMIQVALCFILYHKSYQDLIYFQFCTNLCLLIQHVVLCCFKSDVVALLVVCKPPILLTLTAMMCIICLLLTY